MKKMMTMVMVLFAFLKAAGQTSKIQIQKIDIKDKEFIKNITHLIEDLKNGRDEFGFFKKGLGYVSVQVSDYHHGDTLLRYSALQQASAFSKDTHDGLYPQYYTIIDGHPVLLYFRSVNLLSSFKYAEDSKRRFREEMDRYLDIPKDTKMYDFDKKKYITAKNFREEYYKLGTGVVFYKFGRQYEE